MEGVTEGGGTGPEYDGIAIQRGHWIGKRRDVPACPIKRVAVGDLSLPHPLSAPPLAVIKCDNHSDGTDCGAASRSSAFEWDAGLWPEMAVRCVWLLPVTLFRGPAPTP